MITDAQVRFSLAQSMIGAAATVVSTNTIDLLSAEVNPGLFDRGRIVAFVDTALAGGTAVAVQVISSASADLSTPTVLHAGAVIADADGVAGYKMLDVKIPNTAQRYLGVQYVKTGTHSAGAISAYIVDAVDNHSFPPANSGY